MIAVATKRALGYKAFISYSHAADGQLAPRLQSALHAFAKPWYRLRAIRVFRDDTNLSISPGLWSSIEQALARSDYFLLLASPQAAASKWVDKEIGFWLEHKSRNTLLIVLTEGNLQWDNAVGDFDWRATDAVPECLSHCFAEEPLFLDLRWARTAVDLSLGNPLFRDRIADLSATLRGVSKDEIVGEEVRQHRRTRTVTWAAGSALAVLAIAATAAALIAVSQRDEAIRQRNLAVARQLASQADLAREERGNPERSNLLATEAVRLVSEVATRVPEVELSLRRTLAARAQPIGRFSEHSDAKLALSADGRHLVVRLPHGGYLAVRDPRTLAHTWQLRLSGKDYVMQPHERPSSTLSPERYSSPCAATYDGRIIALLSIDGENKLEIWETNPAKRIVTLELARRANHECDFSSDGALLAIKTSTFDDASREWNPSFRLWSVREQGDVLAKEPAEFVAFGPGGRHFASSTGVWRLSDTHEAKPTQRIAWSAKPYYVAFSATGRFLAERKTRESPVTVHELGTDNSPIETKPPTGELLAVSDDGQELIVVQNNTRLWDARNNRVQLRLPLVAAVQEAAFDGPLPLIVAANVAQEAPDSAIYNLQVATYRVIPASSALALHKTRVNDSVVWIGFGSGRELFALMSEGGAMRLEAWTWERDAAKVRLDVPVNASAPWTISADGDHYAVAGAKGVVVGQLGASGELAPISPAAPPQQLALSSTATFLALASSGSIELWDLARRERTAMPQFDGAPIALRVSSDGAVVSALIQKSGPATRSGSAFELLRWRGPFRSEPVVLTLGRHLDLSPCTLEPNIRDFFFQDALSKPAAGDEPGSNTSKAASASVDRGDTCEGVSSHDYLVSTTDTTVRVHERRSNRAIALLEHPGKVRLTALSRDQRFLASADEVGELRIWPLTAVDLLAQACARSPLAPTLAEWHDTIGTEAGTDSCGRPLQPVEQGR